MMGTSETAKRLGVKGSRVRQLAISGVLHGRKLGRDWFFTEDEIAEYEKVRTPRGRPRATPKQEAP